MIQQKFSLPLACPILALIGLALGATNRKDGKLGSFVIGIGVIFVYYVLLWGARAAAMGGRFSPELAPWMPEHRAWASAAWSWWSGGPASAISRSGSACRRSGARRHGRRARARRRRQPRRRRATRRSSIAFPTSICRCPGCSTSTSRASISASSLLGLARAARASSTSRRSSISPTSCSAAKRRRRCCCATSISARRSSCTTSSRWACWSSTLVTIGVMTKNSELLVMRACGISLYRAAVPLLLLRRPGQRRRCSLMQERVLAYGEPRGRPARAHHPRTGPPATTALNRRWMVGHQRRDVSLRFLRSSAPTGSRTCCVYRLDDSAWRLRAVTRASDAVLVPPRDAGDRGGRRGWRAAGLDARDSSPPRQRRRNSRR